MLSEVFKIKGKNLLLMIFAVAIVSFVSFFLGNIKYANAARCMEATSVDTPCTTILTGTSCSMVDSDSCYAEQSTLDASVCVVSNTTYLDTKHTIGSDTNCLSFRECLEDQCPTDNAGTNDGDNCWVSKNDSSLFGGEDWSTVTKIEGKWDEFSSSCILCNGKLEGKTCGNTSGTYYNGGTTCDLSGTGKGKFESACGAASACDEQVEGYACSSGKTCDANGQCVAAATCDTDPTVTIKPLTQSGLAGAQLSYTINVKNNDDATCPTASRTFNLSSFSKPVGWTNSFTYTSLPVSKGGGTNSTIYKLTSSSGASEKNYPFTIKVYDAKSSVKSSANYTVTTCSANTFIKFNSDKYKKGSMLKISSAIGSSEPTNDFARCVYNPSGVNEWESLVAHSLGSGDMSGSVNTTTGNVVGVWITSLKSGTSCPATPSGCIGSTKVVDCLSDTDCAPDTCDLSTHTCVAAATPPPPVTPAGPISAPLCESALIASDEGTFCGGHKVLSAEIGGWCCSAADFVATNKDDCNNMDPACAAPVAPVTPACDGTGAGEICNPADNSGCTSPQVCSSDCKSCITPPCSGVGMFTSPLSSGYCTIGEIVENATNWILTLVSSIIILILIIGGIMYISSSGNEEKITKAKNMIFYAVLGLGIILIAYALITEVTNLLKGV